MDKFSNLLNIYEAVIKEICATFVNDVLDCVI